MARVYVAEGQDQGDVARALLELAGDDPAAVRVLAGEGAYGAFEVSDEIADGYDPDRVGHLSDAYRARQKPAASDESDSDDAKTSTPARGRRSTADKTTKPDT